MSLEHRLSELPLMTMAFDDGSVIEHPEYRMLCASGREWTDRYNEDIIPLPFGADLHVLPGRYPVGIDPETGERHIVQEFDGRPVNAVSAFLPPAYTVLYLAAFSRGDEAPLLPLYAYSSLGWRDNGFVTTAVRIDPDIRQDLANYPDDGSEDRNARKAVEDNPDNRLIRHLAHCCTVYRCPAARNLFLGRYEAPLPTSTACNAQCLGCISLQKDGQIPATQDRIDFRPTAAEITGVAVPHILRAENPVVSFGQGCEGEPLTRWDLLEESIRMIRGSTDKGTINLNTNAGDPEALRKLFEAGLDSMRVSLNSTREDLYHSYFKPADYTFDDVVESMRIAREMDRFVSLNYFVFPGLTDEEEEIDGLISLKERTDFNMIQWRNLNIDPEFYMDSLGWTGGSRGMGVSNAMGEIRKKYPELVYGYFNPHLS